MFIIDEAYLFFEHLTPEERERIAHYMTKLRFDFAGGKRKLHIYELRDGVYVDTGRVEEWTYEEYIEWRRSTGGRE